MIFFTWVNVPGKVIVPLTYHKAVLLATRYDTVAVADVMLGGVNALEPPPVPFVMRDKIAMVFRIGSKQSRLEGLDCYLWFRR